MYNSYYQTPLLTPPPQEEPPAPPEKPPRPKKRGAAGRAVLFGLTLLLIAAGIAALAVLRGQFPTPDRSGLLDRLMPSELPTPPYGGDDFWDFDGDDFWGGDSPYYGYDFPSSNQGPSQTTVERYPAGGVLRLELAKAPYSGALSFQKIYTKVLPSIVGIRSYGTAGGATGTGVVLTADGYIVTNFHVIEGASRVEILLQNDQLYRALLVGGDRTNDLAVLKIDVDGLTPAEFGDSDLLQVGDATLALGNPLGEELKNTMTDGIVSAINRDVNNDGVTQTLIQTTAALNPGNSGGALINIYGQVVGITNMKMMSDYDTIEGLGFAIPSTTVQWVVEQLVAHGKLVGRPTLGITVQEFSEELWGNYELPEGFDGGLLVVGVQRQSDAWKSGVREGDILLEADRRPIHTIDDLLTLKNSKAVGDHIRMVLWRDGRRLTINVTLIDQYELDNIEG